MAVLYFYKGCTSCERAKAWLTDHGIPFDLKRLYTETPTAEEWREAARRLGGAAQLVARRSRRFKELDPEVATLSEDEIIDLLLREPRIARRPLYLDGGRALVGWDERAYRDLLG